MNILKGKQLLNKKMYLWCYYCDRCDKCSYSLDFYERREDTIREACAKCKAFDAGLFPYLTRKDAIEWKKAYDDEEWERFVELRKEECQNLL